MTAKEEGLLLKDYLIDLGISKRMLTDIKFDGGDLLINGEHVTVNTSCITETGSPFYSQRKK